MSRTWTPGTSAQALSTRLGVQPHSYYVALLVGTERFYLSVEGGFGDRQQALIGAGFQF